GDGRLAYLYDTVGQLDAPRQAFVLGLWLANASTRLERFLRLATVGVGAYRDWHLKTLPFGRASYDLAMTLARVGVNEDGTPATGLTRGFWSRALVGREAPSDEDQPLDAAWLTETIGSSDVRQRGDRLDQLAFGQRLLRSIPPADDAERSDLLFVIRSF